MSVIPSLVLRVSPSRDRGPTQATQKLSRAAIQFTTSRHGCLTLVQSRGPDVTSGRRRACAHTHTSCAGARAATHISHAHHTSAGTHMNMFRIGAACDTSIPELTNACAPHPFPRIRHSTHPSGHPASRWPHLPWALLLTLQYTSVALCEDEHMKERWRLGVYHV